MLRVDWTELDDDVRAAVQARTGPVLRAESATAGMNSEVAAFLRTSGRTFFIKGRRLGHPGVVTQQREAMINPYVSHLSARLLWQLEVGDWHILAFQYLSGRHADYTPGSPDLPKVVDAVRRLARTPCPDLPLKLAEQRWADYLEPDERALLRGGTLLHTDFNPVNVLVADDTVRLIDWAWPTRGAAFIDPACLAVRLMTAGHTPAQAEAVVGRTGAWTAAPPAAVDAFSRAAARMWREIADADPQPWKQATAAAAAAWTAYRCG